MQAPKQLQFNGKVLDSLQVAEKNQGVRKQADLDSSLESIHSS